MPIQVNVTTKVNSKSIRREQYNGREHLVLPSYTLPANVVMNGGLYPSSEIDAHYQKLEGTLAPLGHPQLDGQFVSAFSAEGINQGHVGAWNRNAKKAGNRIYVEKWVDVEVASQSEKGRRLLDRVNALEAGEDVPPIHTSVAVFLERMEANEGQRAQGIEWVAKIHSVDHDAILLDEVGAATPEQGVGLMVNADKAVSLEVNAGALEGESYRDKERRLEQAARDRFVTNDNEYVWIGDFTDAQAVIVRNGGDAERYDYTTEDGRIRFSDTGTAVERKETWITKIPALNHLINLFRNHQARPDSTTQEGDMPLTPEEKAELAKEIGANVGQVLADQLKPIADKVDALEANQKSLSDSLTANQKAEEAEKRRAVAEKHGEVVANALSGEALDAMYKGLGDAASLAGNSGQQGDALTADVSNLPKE